MQVPVKLFEKVSHGRPDAQSCAPSDRSKPDASERYDLCRLINYCRTSAISSSTLHEINLCFRHHTIFCCLCFGLNRYTVALLLSHQLYTSSCRLRKKITRRVGNPRWLDVPNGTNASMEASRCHSDAEAKGTGPDKRRCRQYKNVSTNTAGGH